MADRARVFRVKRFDPDRGHHWHQEYSIPVTPGMTVLEALWHIVHYVDGTLSFRYSCRGAVCGSCAMIINETITLACHTQISSLPDGTVEIEPLPRLQVIKDLVVDVEPFLEKFRSIGPFLEHADAHERETLQSPQERQEIADSARCLLCGSCHAACPLTAVDPDYLGPAALTAAQRFAFDNRNDRRHDVLRHVNTMEGVGNCRTISRCTEVCPKLVAPSDRIKELKERVRQAAFQDRPGPAGEESLA